MAAILLDGITVERSGIETLHELSLSIEDGEFMVVLGPSGSGKTSLLRAIAGLDTPTRGDILFDGHVVTDVQPHDRDVAMVFQDNALLPFRTVRRNVSFPLELHAVERSEIDRRVTAETRALDVERFLERLPRQLGAGHQQLAQAARALVRRPSVFLLDEPLSRVDPVLRQEMRNEIRTLQRGYGVTALYATNDTTEAMALADRVVVLDTGRVRQVGAPRDVYRKPCDVFVAEFLGSPPMNLLSGRASGREVRLAAGALPLRREIRYTEVTVGIRPEDWETVHAAGLPGVVSVIENHGDHLFVHVDLAGDEIVMRSTDTSIAPGDRLQVWAHRYLLFGPDGRRLDLHDG